MTPTPSDAGLIERLRANAGDYTGELQCEAADRITSQAAEIAGLRALCREAIDGLVGNTAIIIGGKNHEQAQKAGERLNALIEKIRTTLGEQS